jgi:heme oxygenase (biliverdin-IX-beta and delta-forming)
MSWRRMMLRGRITSMNGANLDSEHEVSRAASAGTTKPPSTIDLLRARTAEHHHGLESGLQVQHRLSQVATRGPLIAGYFALYRKTEAALAPHLRDMPDLAFCSRVRARRFPGKTGLPRQRLLVDPVFAAIETKAEALGALYVLEGSTLGGRKILQALKSQGVPTADLDFLDPYGRDAGVNWRMFLGILERETALSRTTMNECVSGAIKAFSLAATCLRDERKN